MPRAFSRRCSGPLSSRVSERVELRSTRRAPHLSTSAKTACSAGMPKTTRSCAVTWNVPACGRDCCAVLIVFSRKLTCPGRSRLDRFSALAPRSYPSQAPPSRRVSGSPGLPGPTRCTAELEASALDARLEPRRRHLDTGELEAGSDGAPYERPCAEALRLLPGVRGNHDRWALAGRQVHPKA